MVISPNRQEEGAALKESSKALPLFSCTLQPVTIGSVSVHTAFYEVLSLQGSPPPLPTWLSVPWGVSPRCTIGGGHELGVEELPRIPLSTVCSLSGQSGPGPEFGPIPWRPVRINNAGRSSWNLGRLNFQDFQLYSNRTTWPWQTIPWLSQSHCFSQNNCSGEGHHVTTHQVLRCSLPWGELLTGKMTGWWAAGPPKAVLEYLMLLPQPFFVVASLRTSTQVLGRPESKGNNSPPTVTCLARLCTPFPH